MRGEQNILCITDHCASIYQRFSTSIRLRTFETNEQKYLYLFQQLNLTSTIKFFMGATLILNSAAQPTHAGK